MDKAIILNSELHGFRDPSEEDIIGLISSGVDVNIPVSNWYPLQLAIYRGWSADVVKAIILAGADLNVCANIDPDSKYYLKVEYGEVQNLVPISIAAILGRTDVVKLLIDAGADVNKKSSCGRSPLYALYDIPEFDEVSEDDYKKIEKLLLDAGAEK